MDFQNDNEICYHLESTKRRKKVWSGKKTQGSKLFTTRVKESVLILYPPQKQGKRPGYIRTTTKEVYQSVDKSK